MSEQSNNQSGIKINLFISTPVAILIGSVIISLAILINSGIIKFKSKTTSVTVPNSGTTQAAPNQVLPEQPVAGPVESLKAEDHVRGERNARILLFEYSDLECPFCKRFHPTAKQIVDEYKGQVAWVYRHFPLDQIHSKADKEAESVECANELGGQDAFWKLTDKIFEVTPANNGLNLDDLPKLAGEVGLNQSAFKTCLDSGKYTNHVEADYQGGIKAGITGTPGNILLDNKTKKTKLIPGALPFEQFKQTIDGMLKES